MPRRLDLTGLVTKGHTVVSFAGMTRHGGTTWSCRCSICGSEYVSGSGHAQMDAPCRACCMRQSGFRRRKHGLTVRSAAHKMFHTWSGIKQRCSNPKCTVWCRYGGRGIRMHEPWVTDAGAFVEYVTNLPHYGEEGRSLDRIDNDGNYEPGNLRWATRREQSLNMCRNRYITHNGETRTVSEWAKLTGLGQTFVDRFYAGAGQDRLFNPSVQKFNRLFEHNGEQKTAKEWATVLGVPLPTIYWRAKRGKPLTK